MDQENIGTACSVEGCDAKVMEAKYLTYNLCMLHFYLEQTALYGSE